MFLLDTGMFLIEATVTIILPFKAKGSNHGNCLLFKSQQIQNICITFRQRRPNVFDVGPTLYKCYTNVLCLLVSLSSYCRATYGYLHLWQPFFMAKFFNFCNCLRFFCRLSSCCFYLAWPESPPVGISEQIPAITSSVIKHLVSVWSPKLLCTICMIYLDFFPCFFSILLTFIESHMHVKFEEKDAKHYMHDIFRFLSMFLSYSIDFYWITYECKVWGERWDIWPSD